MSDNRNILWFSSGIFVGCIISLLVPYHKFSDSSQKSYTDVPITSVKDATFPKETSFPLDLKSELLSRAISFFGEEKFRNVEKSFVIVVGLGGVGSHAANMLVRTGVRKIRLIDFDQVSLSSLNRHAVATLEDVGTSKAETMMRKLTKICPW